MGNGFYPGMVIGVLLGVLVTMISLAILSRTTKTTTEHKNDPADWWKRGEPPPHED